MQTTEEKKIIELDKIDVSKLSDFQKFKEKQLLVIKENPFIEISDYESYRKAKEARTALVRARTTIEKQDKLIASKISAFRKRVIALKKELIDISSEAEIKQQNEVKRWEEIKEAEKAERERVEAERKEKIKAKITEFYNAELKKINSLTYDETQEKLQKIGEGVDVSKLQEFNALFYEKCNVLEELRENRIISLKQEEEQRIERARIQKEREELERKRREQEEAMRLQQEAIERRRREEEKALKLQREAIERKQKEAEEALLKIENEKRLKEEAEEKAERERLEAENAKKEEENRKKMEEALMPEAEKIINYVKSLRFVKTPPIINDEALKLMMKNFDNRLKNLKKIFIQEINNEATKWKI